MSKADDKAAAAKEDKFLGKMLEANKVPEALGKDDGKVVTSTVANLVNAAKTGDK